VSNEPQSRWWADLASDLSDGGCREVAGEVGDIRVTFVTRAVKFGERKWKGHNLAVREFLFAFPRAYLTVNKPFLSNYLTTVTVML
jgi:hypothetical protein